MPPPGLLLTTALLCAVLSSGAVAQAGASAPSAAASASPAGKPGRKPLTPQQLRDSATAPGELRPEHPVVPQINVPLGKKRAAAPQPRSNTLRGGNAASGVGIDDAVARCEAQLDKQVRADCRARLAREGRMR